MIGGGRGDGDDGGGCGRGCDAGGDDHDQHGSFLFWEEGGCLWIEIRTSISLCP